MSRPPVSDSAREYGQRLGVYLRELRKQQHRSAQQVAEASDLSIDTVRSIETGRVAAPSFFTISRIAFALGVELDEILTGISLTDGGLKNDS
jgi:transcriptional regulator with XRE-family HTH domain